MAQTVHEPFAVVPLHAMPTSEYNLVSRYPAPFASTCLSVRESPAARSALIDAGLRVPASPPGEVRSEPEAYGAEFWLIYLANGLTMTAISMLVRMPTSSRFWGVRRPSSD